MSVNSPHSKEEANALEPSSKEWNNPTMSIRKILCIPLILIVLQHPQLWFTSPLRRIGRNTCMLSHKVIPRNFLRARRAHGTSHHRNGNSSQFYPGRYAVYGEQASRKKLYNKLAECKFQSRSASDVMGYKNIWRMYSICGGTAQTRQTNKYGIISRKI